MLNPSWECFIDGTSIGSVNPTTVSLNNWMFCDQEGLQDGPHSITVNVSVSPGQTFWFDQLQYVPSATVSMENKEIYIGQGDSQMLAGFDSSWTSIFSNSSTMSQTTNGTFTFDFIGESDPENNPVLVIWNGGPLFLGQSLSWYGLIPSGGFPTVGSTGTYTIDQGNPSKFSLQAASNSTVATIYNVKFFETPQLTQGLHNIAVSFKGSSSTTPLNVEFLVIQNGTQSPAASSTTSTSPAPPSASPRSGGHGVSKHNIGPIVGGAVSGATILALLALWIYYIRRRSKRRGNSMHFEYANPFIARFTARANIGSSSGEGRGEFTRIGASAGLTSKPSPYPLHATRTYQPITTATLLGRSGKRQGAEAARLPQDPRGPGGGLSGGALSSLALTSDTSVTTRPVIHEDSGIRLVGGDPFQDVPLHDVPPQYTVF